MDSYFEQMSIIFFGFYGLILCQNLCIHDRNASICCSDYHVQNGKCVACPSGYFGVDCSKMCPKGYFGEFCAKVCHCTEKQVCNMSQGCVDSKALSTRFYKTELQTPHLPTHEQTTVLTFEQTTEVQNTKSTREFPGPLFLYLLIAGCSTLFCIVCVLVVYRTFRHPTGEIKQKNQAPLAPTPPEPDRNDSPHHVVLNVNAEASGSDYAEIHECNHTYSTGAEVSSIYNVLSFSRSKYISETFNSLSGIYGTSNSCSPQRNETTSIETKSNETDNAPLNPEDFVADTEKECGKDGASISQEGDE